jgi:protein gp37
MAGKSKIEWTESTWNPVTGCTKISAGCANCYAERLAKRLKAMGQKNYQNGFEVTLHERMLEYPLKSKTPQTIFVNSMSDLFHEDVPFDYIQKVFSVMHKAHWHRFQVLTKRSERLAELIPLLKWTPNIWMGVTVENSDCMYRIDLLRQTNAHTKFLSIEPLLSSLPGLDLSGIDWVIVGGESGPGARPMQAEWVREIRDCSSEYNVPFFFKQWGGTNKKQAGKILDGRIWAETPNDAIFEKHTVLSL